MKKKMNQLHEKEIEVLKEMHQAELDKLEMCYNKKILEKEQLHRMEIDEIKNEYEARIMEMSNTFDKTVDEKDTLIKELEEAVHEQCNKMETEVKFIKSRLLSNKFGKENYIAKIVNLQQVIEKMEKAMKKQEKDHHKQISKLVKEIGKRERANQVIH